MISEYVREQKRYTQQEISRILHCNGSDAVSVIRKLKEFGVLKVVKATNDQKDMSDLAEEDIEVTDVEAGENEYLYVFTFVGVITVAGRVLKCYPKYLLNNLEPLEELKQILKVLEKYNSRQQIIRMFNDSSESSSFNLLAVLLFLLEDYYKNGSYSNTRDVIESNGAGEILWDKTINETFTWLSEDRPYYTDFQTIKRTNDDYDYFKRLHECILTIASKELSDAELLDLFEITPVDLSEELLDDFGDKDYILYRIENELGVQFNTRKQLVLKTLYAYVAHSGNLYETEALSMIGTNSFNLVWENVCAEILDNKLDTPVGSLQLPVPLKEGYQKKDRLIDLIEKPYWSATGHMADDTLIPDVISIYGNEFIIFDAKYYNAALDEGKKPKAQPGIESVTKQYLYQLAYQQFITDHGFVAVKNCFLMPTSGEKIENKGFVSMKMLAGVGLQNIEVRLLPAHNAFEYYIYGRKLDLSSLML